VRTLFLAIVLLAGPASAALAECVTNTIIGPGMRYQVCTTCCFAGTCTTTCF
jgi:hypothetical protein